MYTVQIDKQVIVESNPGSKSGQIPQKGFSSVPRVWRWRKSLFFLEVFCIAAGKVLKLR